LSSEQNLRVFNGEKEEEEEKKYDEQILTEKGKKRRYKEC